MNSRLVVLLLACCATAPGRTFTYTAFRTPAEIESAFAALAAANPGFASWSSVGTSIEGRPIKALKLSSTPSVDDPSKGDVVFVGLHHAREWIAVEMALFLADELLTLRTTDTELQNDLNRLQVWIIPVVNPDGYAYTNTTYRYWRKNRRLNSDGSHGVDLNRNYGFQWGLLSGSSATPPDETYHGTGPFSEPETTVIRNFLDGRKNLRLFVSYHSFSELYLVPWSYTTAPAPGGSTLQAVNNRNIARVAAVHGHTYGPSIWYTSSGEATDWIWDRFRIHGVTPELRPAVGSAACPLGDLSCFSPPPTEILPNSEENFAAARALIHDAALPGIWIKDHPGDTGAEPSAVWTASGWSAPFWTSPDITTTPPGPLVGGSTVTLNVTVHNSTGSTQNNVVVDAYYTDPRISLEFPNPDSILIGTRTQSLSLGDTTITMPWTVPTGPNSWGEYHWCVGVVIKHDRDMPLSTQIQKSSNIGGKNFETAPMRISQNLIVAMDNRLGVAGEMKVIVDRERLPAGWKVTAALPAVTRQDIELPTAMARKARLLGVKNPVIEPGQTVYIPIRVVAPPGTPPGTQVDITIHGGISPLVPGKRDHVGNGFTYRVVVE